MRSVDVDHKPQPPNFNTQHIRRLLHYNKHGMRGIWSLVILLSFLYSSSIAMTTSHCESVDLLPALRTAFPQTQTYEIQRTIPQSNAVGYIVQLDRGSQVFVKRVHAGDYVHKKEWADLRRTLMYARTEARFYREFAPLLRQRGFQSIPQSFTAEYSLEGWISEDEHSTDPAGTGPDLSNPGDRGGLLVLDCITTHSQASPLTLDQCRQCLRAAASLHSAAWGDVELLDQAKDRLSQASFHLGTRNPKELRNIVQAWDHFASAFTEPLREAGLENIGHLGRRIQPLAETISRRVSPGPKDASATLIHGDYKSMNVFLPVKEGDSAVLVDFASVGVGLGMSDVAMHLRHAVRPELLDDDGGEEALVRYYCEQLNRPDYTFEQGWKDYQWAVLDYFRFFLGRFWRSATPESMAKLAPNENTNLINRDVASAMAFVRRVDEFLTALEAEAPRCE